MFEYNYVGEHDALKINQLHPRIPEKQRRIERTPKEQEIILRDSAMSIVV